LRFAGNVAARGNSKNLVDLNIIEIKEIIRCDGQMFPARRDGFLSKWISQRWSKALGYISGGRLAGYGVLRPCVTGFKVGPLFADSKEIAQELLSGLADHANGQVFIDVPEPNLDAVDLVQSSGMKKVFETARMYNRNIPRLPLGRVYGATTLELG
jgi:hypothetical protein